MSVHIYANGLCHCSACVPIDMDRDSVEAAVNALNPAGTEYGWRISQDAEFKDGKPNPCQCEQDSSRTHYLLNC